MIELEVLASAFTERQCLSVVCTSCGLDYDDDRTVHFDSMAHALGYILPDGWVVGEDTILCVSCGEDTRPEQLSAVVCEYCAPPLFPGDEVPDRCTCHSSAVMVPFVSHRHPGFERHHCVTIKCVECGEGLGGDDEGEPHYRSREDAIKAARRRSWMVTDRVVCRDCVSRMTCVALGHDWPEVADYVMDEGIEVRWCRHCGEPVKNLVTDKDMPWL